MTDFTQFEGLAARMFLILFNCVAALFARNGTSYWRNLPEGDPVTRGMANAKQFDALVEQQGVRYALDSCFPNLLQRLRQISEDSKLTSKKKLEIFFGYLARCEGKFCTTTLKNKNLDRNWMKMHTPGHSAKI